MKYCIYISFLFLLSCSAEKWQFEDCSDCQVQESTKKYQSPNGDYSIEIPKNWKPYHYNNDSSNVVFNLDLESPEIDSNNIVVASVFRYNGGNYSDPNGEHKKNMDNLKKDYPGLNFIEHGETDVLGFHSYYLHTVEPVKNKPDNIDLYFQVPSEIDSNYYVLQIHCMANGQEKYNMCLMTEMLKTFKLK